jgi:hypothetical protein
MSDFSIGVLPSLFVKERFSAFASATAVLNSGAISPDVSVSRFPDLSMSRPLSPPRWHGMQWDIDAGDGEMANIGGSAKNRRN